MTAASIDERQDETPAPRLRDRTARGRGRRRRSPHPRDVLVAVLGVAGAAAIAWLAASWLLGLHLVVLTTGSMSPAMPPGTAVVTRVVPATELEVGQVVSVPRAHDAQLVTHRIVRIADTDRESARNLTLKGDANDTQDAQPYIVDRAAVAVASAPGLGYLVTWLSSPISITVLAILIPAAVLWVLWPSRR